MSYPFGLWLPVLGVAVGVLLLAATVSLSFMAFAVSGEALSAKERLISRMSRPLAMLATIAGWLLVLCFALFSVIHGTAENGLPSFWLPFGGAIGFMLLHSAIIGSVILWGWKRVASAKRHRIGLFCLGLLFLTALVCAFVQTLYLFAALDPAMEATLSLFKQGQAVVASFFARTSLSEIMGIFALILGASLAGACVLAFLWLLIRRSKDDFGRDYYVHTLRFCAGYGAVGAALLWVGQALYLPTLLSLYTAQPEMPARLAALFADTAPLSSWISARLGMNPLEWFGLTKDLLPLLAFLLVQCVLPLFALLAFVIVRKAVVPLRHKLSILFGSLCVIASVWGNVLLISLLL